MTKTPLSLALAAGGARGAYQAGALLYFAERGLRFGSVAGSSIGALNSAYYAQGDGSAAHMQQLINLWRSVPYLGILQVTEDVFQAAFQMLLTGDLAALKWFLSGESTFFDPAPIAALFDRWLDYEKIRTSSITATITVFPQIMPLFDVITGPWRKAEYLRLQELSPTNMKLALLASSAIPMIFPAQMIEGQLFADAGLSNPLPAQVLYQNGSQRIVSIFLSNRVVQNRVDFPDCTLLQIHPPSTMKIGLKSMLDFSQQTIDRLIDLGYKTAQECFEEAEEIFTSVVQMRDQGAKNVRLAQQLSERDKPLF